MALRVVTAPAVEPVSLSEAKAHLRLEETVDDTYVTALISAARVHAEKMLGRGLVLQTVELTLPGFRTAYESPVELPGGHLAEVPQLVVQYLDVDDATQTLGAASTYTVSQGELAPGLLYLADGASWPDVSTRADAVQIRYRVGWADAASVPAPIKQALLLLISQMYEQRSPEGVGSTTVDALLSPFTFWGL